MRTYKRNTATWPALIVLLGLMLISPTSYAERMCRDTNASSATGTLTDSGGANRNYRNNQSCQFEISASPGDTIELSFADFEFETNRDFLAVYDGSSTTAPLLGRFTDDTTPPDLTATSGSMLVVISTDNRRRRDGFVATWTITAGVSCPTQTLADNFTNVSYDQNDGTQNWLGDWQEIGETDGPSAGIARVNNANCTNGNCLRIGEPGNRSSWTGRGALRAADLFGATTVTLSFNYRTGHGGGSQTVDLEISSNGGQSWQTLETYRVNSTSFTAVAETFDISAFAAADTRIRFISDGNNARTGLYIDDLVIEHNPPCLPTPLAEWHFDEPNWSGANVVEDQLGNLTGQAQGGADTIEAGQICRAGRFDGVNDYIQVTGIDTHLQGTASLSFWLSTNQSGTNTAWLAPGLTGIEENGGIDDVFWGYIRTAGTISIATGDVDPNFSTTPVNDDQWHHIVIARDAATGELLTYVDGALENTTVAATGTIGRSFGSLGRIEDTGGSPEYLQGTVDEVIIFEGVLSAAEVAQIYAHQRIGNNWDGSARSCPANGVSHFRVEHDTTGIHCAEEVITIRALDASDNQVAGYSGQVTLDTQSGRGSWRLISGQGNLVDTTTNDGQATYQFVTGDGGEAVFALSYPEGPSAFDIDVWQTSDPSVIDDDAEGLLTFAPSGFTITANALTNPPSAPINDPISTQDAGRDFDVHITAFGTTPDDPTCGVIEAYAGIRSLAFRLNRVNPSSGTINATIEDTSIGNTYAARTPIDLSFAAGQATVSAKYKDVGEILIELTDESSFSHTLSGATNSFVVRPAYLEVSEVTTTTLTPNPAATTMTTDPFVPSGEAFRVVVTVRDAENDITPNYGLENSPESVRIQSDSLVAPVGGRNGSINDVFNGQAFTRTAGGVFTNTTVAFDEVGIIQLRAQVADLSYLNTGLLTSPVSANVGRFYPHHFHLISSSVTPSCGPFTYAGQPELQVSTVIEARNQLGGRLENYDGSLIAPGGVATTNWSAENADDGVDLASRLTINPTTWITGRHTTNDLAATFSRLATPDGPFDQLQIGIAVVDALDGRTLDGRNIDPSNTGDCVVAGTCQAQSVGTASMVRSGRMLVGSGSAPEFENLDIPLRAEFWDGTGFRLNSLDSCSTYQSTLADLSTYLLNLSDGETTPIQPASSTPLSGGVAASSRLLLSAPGIGNDGSVLVELTVPSWLQFNWLGTGNVNPRARQTFGHYRGHDAIVYWDEITRE